MTGFGSITYPNLASIFAVNVTYQAAASSSSSSSGLGLLAFPFHSQFHIHVIVPVVCVLRRSGLSLMSITLIVFAVLVGVGLLVLSASLFARWRSAKARRGAQADDIVTATEVRIINGQTDGGSVHLTVNPTGRAARSPPSSKSLDSAEIQNAISISLLDTPREADVWALMELGFSRELALTALRQNGNNVQRAASFLTSS